MHFLKKMRLGDYNSGGGDVRYYVPTAAGLQLYFCSDLCWLEYLSGSADTNKRELNLSPHSVLNV